MKFTVTLPRLDGMASDVVVLSGWLKEIGELVQPGDPLAQAGDATISAPVHGVLAKKIVLPGEAVEVGEPLAVLAGVSEPLVAGNERRPLLTAAPYIPAGPAEAHLQTPLQQSIARHMARSMQVAPHVYTVATVDVTEVVRLAGRFQTSPTPFVICAAAAALADFPELNAQFVRRGEIRRNRYIHIASVVHRAGRTVAPVITDADKKSPLALVREWDALMTAAKDGTLPLEAQRGATFSISEISSPVQFQTPILHQPQAAHLSVGPAQLAPVVTAEGNIATRPTVSLCLAHDARITDSETAAAFVAEVKRNLEETRFLFV